ncbi:MAG TPA: hypothetical protein VN408_21945 [Actinoplanes sp.]|nr:hypothetical protein [Actinoplanes sp.]
MTAAAVTATIATLLAAFWNQRTSGQTISAELAGELSERAVPIIEQKLTMDWFAGAAGQRMVCVARPLGTDPASAQTISAVETVYVWALCATTGTKVRSEMSKPMAVHLTGPGGVEAPTDGESHASQVERIFPERLHDVVLGDIRVEDLEAALEDRIATTA